MRTTIIKYRPPRIAMLLLVVAAALHLAAPLLSLELVSSRLGAMILGLTGFAVMIQAWRQFRQQQVAICPTEPTALLITDGIYRFSRNPMYLGMIVMIGGVALWVGTAPFYAALIGYFLIIEFAFCPFEEQKLESTFGGDYRKYRATVRRWI